METSGSSNQAESPTPPIVVESLHVLRRTDSRLPVFVIVTAEPSGRILAVGACDAEEYG